MKKTLVYILALVFMADAAYAATPVQNDDVYKDLDQLAENAFDDQCTGANPRYPMISEIKELFIKAYNG